MSRRNTTMKLGAALLTIPLMAACLGTGAPPAQNKPSGQGAQGGQRQIAVPVNVASVSRGNLAATLTYSGNIQSRASVNVLPLSDRVTPTVAGRTALVRSAGLAYTFAE